MSALVGIIGVMFIAAVVYLAVQKHRAKSSGPSIPGGSRPHDGGGPPSDVDKV